MQGAFTGIVYDGGSSAPRNRDSEQLKIEYTSQRHLAASVVSGPVPGQARDSEPELEAGT